MRLENCIFVVVFLFCVLSCGYTSGGVRPLLDKAELILETAPDSAFVALDSLDRSLLNTRELKARHALLYSIALEKVGVEVFNDSIITVAIDYYSEKGDRENLEKALSCLEQIHENAMAVSPSDSLRIQNARIIEERYADKMALVDKDRKIRRIVLLSLLALAVLSVVIRRIVKKLGRRPDPAAMEIINQRLAVLDKLIASRISSDDRLWRESEEEIDVMMSDREQFLRSTKVIFDESHPEFTAYLEGRGLTDWETGYCCLYTLGLKGKDIGEYIQKKRHYIISHEIRQKLGLDEHDTNIGIYLRRLLVELER